MESAAARPHFRPRHARTIDGEGTEGSPIANSTAISGQCNRLL